MVVCWNHLRNTRRNVGRYFPGNAHVDAVTMDPYENGATGPVLTEDDWKRFAGTCENDTFTGPAGMLDWAEQHGLKSGFDEWGCVNRKSRNPSGRDLDPASPTNNGFYVRKMDELFRDAVDRGIMSHQCYFQTGRTGVHQIWPETLWNANVREAYLALYRRAAA